ncbi:MAG: DMT family transporter [Candidatus Dormibacteraeota bacterium]|nr:DMT family transporter [Candidatus Dormibacteraeota bacterium]
MRRHLPALVALITVIVWGVNFPFLKIGLAQMSPLAFTFWRYLLMLALAWSVLAWRHRRSGTRLTVDPADYPRLALAGVLGFSLYMVLSIVGVSETTAFSNALMIALAPLFSALFLVLWRMERIRASQVLGMFLSLAGVALFLADKARGGVGIQTLGDLLSLLAALFYAAYTVSLKPLLSRYPATVVTAYTLSIGGVPVLWLSAPAVLVQDWGSVDLAGWSVLVWASIFPVYAAWTAWSWATARAGVARTNVFLYLVPVVSGVVALFLLGESFGPLKLAGAVLALSGLVLARRGPVAQAKGSDTRSGSIQPSRAASP